MAFRLQKMKKARADEARTAATLKAFEASFDSGPTKAFVRESGPGDAAGGGSLRAFGACFDSRGSLVSLFLPCLLARFLPSFLRALRGVAW